MNSPVVPETMKRDLDVSSTTVNVKALTMEFLTADGSLSLSLSHTHTNKQTHKHTNTHTYTQGSLGAADITCAYNDGARSKFCCLCCPLTENKSGQGVITYMEKNPSRLPIWGIAVDDDGRAMGYVAMTFYPMQPMDGLHTTKPGEAYIDQVMVSSAARGKGVGTKLLEWAETLARENNCSHLALEVLNGNPAKKLYERFGLQSQAFRSVHPILHLTYLYWLFRQPSIRMFSLGSSPNVQGSRLNDLLTYLREEV